jgi:Ca-activated chloride channel homolog
LCCIFVDVYLCLWRRCFSRNGAASATWGIICAPAAEEPAFVEAPSLPERALAFPIKSEPYDMFFEDYGVNPSVDTEDDNLSTFALDVDTGSYTVMRNYLNDGNLPPNDSVRVEEYVNYFDHGYPLPPPHQAFGIYMDGGPSPFTQTERYDMLRIGIQGYDVADEDRKDAALTFVIDISGSMDMDNRLGLVKRSLELLVEQLRIGMIRSALWCTALMRGWCSNLLVARTSSGF